MIHYKDGVPHKNVRIKPQRKFTLKEQIANAKRAKRDARLLQILTK